MNKKNYISPEIRVRELIHAHNLLAGTTGETGGWEGAKASRFSFDEE